MTNFLFYGIKIHLTELETSQLFYTYSTGHRVTFPRKYSAWLEILTFGVLRSVAVLRAATRPPSLLEAEGSAGAGGGLAPPPPEGGGGGGGGGAPPPDGGSGGGAGGAGAPEGADCVGT